MSRPSDKLATWQRWRLEIALTIATIIGLVAFAQQLLFTDDRSWVAILAAAAAISGGLAALARTGAKLGGGE